MTDAKLQTQLTHQCVII